MDNIKLYEEWWGNSKEKLTHIEEVQEEPNISKEEIQNAVDTYIKLKKKTIFYKNAFNSHNGNAAYFDKTISFYHKTIEQLYRIWKIKHEINIENFNFDKELEENSRRYSGIQLYGSELAKLMYDVTLWLNIMDPKATDKSIYYYKISNQRNGRFYEFKNRIEEEKKREEHKGVDPFGEEEWKE